MTTHEHPWRERDDVVRLLASRRRGQRALRFPPLPPQSPLSADIETVELSPVGSLYSFTIAHSAPKANKAPQPLGLVDFPEGVRIFGRIDYPAGRCPVIGEPLRVFITEVENAAIYAFRPEQP
jgi:uncharacterized OB-fold protein